MRCGFCYNQTTQGCEHCNPSYQGQRTLQQRHLQQQGFNVPNYITALELQLDRIENILKLIEQNLREMNNSPKDTK